MNRGLVLRIVVPLLALLCAACTTEGPPSVPGSTAASVPPSAPVSAEPTPVVRSGESPVEIGEPIDLGTLTGRIVFDDFEDLYTMAADGSGPRRITTRAGAEFDGAWSPDGKWIVYRDPGVLERGLRVNGVAPGPIWTPLIPSTMPAEKAAKFGENTPLGRRDSRPSWRRSTSSSRRRSRATSPARWSGSRAAGR
jgi:hypothetical protein